MRILKVNSRSQREAIVEIKKGRVLIYPTDTVYGLICDATNRKAVEKLFKIKRRPEEKAIPIFVKDIKTAKKIAKIDKKQERILKESWPGKITFILKRKKRLPKILFGNKKTVGFRIPRYKLLNVLLKRLSRPLTSTSANISGKLPSGNIKEVLKQFKNKKQQPDLIIDAGNLPKNKPSIVLDLTAFPPKILRI